MLTTNSTSPIPLAGDRIRLISMENDPDPIPPGTLGTVTWVSLYHDDPNDLLSQISVDWDPVDGRHRCLMLLPATDRWVIVNPVDEPTEDAWSFWV